MRYSANYSAERKKAEGKVPLEAFFKYIANEKSDLESMVNYNGHWKPMELVCYPCAVKFDYFVNIDYLAEEINFIMDKITNGRFHLNIQKRNETRQSRKVDQMHKSGIGEEFFRQVSSIYKIDYEMFGFQYPDRIYF